MGKMPASRLACGSKGCRLAEHLSTATTTPTATTTSSTNARRASYRRIECLKGSNTVTEEGRREAEEG